MPDAARIAYLELELKRFGFNLRRIRQHGSSSSTRLA